MDIWHRVTFNMAGKSEFYNSIIELGVKHKTLQLPGEGGILVFIDIAESEPCWHIVNNHIMTFGASDVKETFFSEEEIRGAEQLRLISTHEQGYPQPKLNWPLKQLSRELLCTKCAIYNQTAPMRVAKEPHWGKKSFLSLIWENQVFCKPEVIQELNASQASGFEDWDVIIHKTGQVANSVRQLYVPTIANPGVVVEEDLERTICPKCGMTKYHPHMKGTMKIKREALLPDVDFQLTHEWFGHGLLAWREVLVSNRVANLILDKKWEGVRFKVVELI